MNQYFGSWHGPAEGLAPALERVGKMFPDKMVVISEFGLAGPVRARHAAGRRGARRGSIREPARRVRAPRLRRGRHLLVLPGLQVPPQPVAGRDHAATSRWASSTRTGSGCRRTPSGRSETSPARLSVEWTQGRPFGPPTGFRATVARRPPHGAAVVRPARLPPRVGGARPRRRRSLASGVAGPARDRRARGRRRLVAGDHIARSCASASGSCARPASWPPRSPSAGGSHGREG